MDCVKTSLVPGCSPRLDKRPVVLFTGRMKGAMGVILLCLGLPVEATVLKFEAVGLTPATELRGLLG